MSRLRAVCCLPRLTEAIKGILSVSGLLLSLSAGLFRTWWHAGWRGNKRVYWYVFLPSEVLQSELLSELITEETWLIGTEMSVGIC